MSNTPYVAYHDGKPVAAACYHGSSDTWYRALMPVDGCGSWRKLVGEAPYRCWCGGPNPWVALVETGDCSDAFAMRACLWCKVLLPPPFDGYDYSKYADEDNADIKAEMDRQIVLAVEAHSK